LRANCAQTFFAYCIIIACSQNAAHAIDFNIKVVDQNGNAVANAAVETNASATTQAPNQIAIIDQINKRFVPMVIAIQKGQRVNFPNKDNIRHHVYSFSPIRQFSTGLYAGIPADPILFPEPGIATLGCNIHDSMVGYIFVSEWADVAVTQNDGIVKFSTTATPSLVKVWHPWASASHNQQQVALNNLQDGDELVVELQINEPSQSFGFNALREE
jgi:plastocyanin